MAGRPKGSKDTQPRNTLARRMVDKAIIGGISPLDVMLRSMRDSWETAEKLRTEDPPANIEEARQRTAEILALRRLAVGDAIQAAPYVHPKLAATTLSGDKENPLHLVQVYLPDNERDAE